MSASSAKKSGTQPQVRIKKIPAYPFSATLELNGIKKPIELIYVGLTGFIAILNVQMVHVGERYQVTFELPKLRETIVSQVRVIKTYDHAVGEKAVKVERMAEFHFAKLSDDYTKHIKAFMAAIGQKK